MVLNDINLRSIISYLVLWLCNEWFLQKIILLVIAATKCTFESNQCGWVNTDKDNFDWKRKQGRTPSYGTGPSVDHTTGTNQGYYMYIETSYGTVGDRARMLSPVFKKV